MAERLRQVLEITGALSISTVALIVACAFYAGVRDRIRRRRKGRELARIALKQRAKLAQLQQVEEAWLAGATTPSDEVC